MSKSSKIMIFQSFPRKYRKHNIQFAILDDRKTILFKETRKQKKIKKIELTVVRNKILRLQKKS